MGELQPTVEEVVDPGDSDEAAEAAQSALTAAASPAEAPASPRRGRKSRAKPAVAAKKAASKKVRAKGKTSGAVSALNRKRKPETGVVGAGAKKTKRPLKATDGVSTDAAEDAPALSTALAAAAAAAAAVAAASEAASRDPGASTSTLARAPTVPEAGQDAEDVEMEPDTGGNEVAEEVPVHAAEDQEA